MATEEIYGFVEHLIYASDSFTVARLKEPRKEILTTVVGPLVGVQPGETIRCKGSWKHHPSHGQQFEIVSFEAERPSDLVGIEKYLSSGVIKGIGPKYAERIVRRFGTETLKILDETPDRLEEIEGIGSKKIIRIKEHWKDQQGIRTVMIFLRAQGVSPGYAQKIYKQYGDKSIEQVQADPFSLARDIHGIGFKIADKIAQQLGIPSDSPLRIEAGIEHLLWELSNDGHTCFPEKEFLPKAVEALELSEELVGASLQKMILEERIMREGEMVWTRPFYFAEMGIAKDLARLRGAQSALRSVKVEVAITWVEEKIRVRFAYAQREAISQAMQEKLHIVTGGPGTGKSTITRAILAITEKLSDKILLAAPTGRAAKRLAEITGRRASTIHSLLEIDFQGGGGKKNRENPLECDLLIVDELSMVDTFLFSQLLKALPSTARLILIGDADQLPSVGAGNVLKDLIASERIGVTRLHQIFRQGEGSQIVESAHRINQGLMPDISHKERSDFLFIEEESPEGIASIILDLVTEKLPRKYRFHRLDDIQVLAPMKRGIVGIENLNVMLQKHLNPSPAPLTRMGKTFHVGDKVMQIRNNYDKFVFNGDIGKIVSIDLMEQAMEVSFDGKLLVYDFAELDELMVAYAVSIHKYQGSEAPCVILPIHTTHFKMLLRNLVYTGITRGKKLVILVGTKKALAIAVQTNDVQKRFTGLADAIRKYLGQSSALT